MYGVLRLYKMKSAATDTGKVVAAARDGFLPIVTKIPGFESYTMALSEAGELATIGFFLDSDAADESTRLAGEWARDHLLWAVEGPPKTASGLVRLQERLSGSVSYETMRRWHLQPGKMRDALGLLRLELLPVLSRTPGFVTLAVIESGTDEFLSVATWRDRASADEATRHATALLQQNALHLLVGPPEKLEGRILLTA